MTPLAGRRLFWVMFAPGLLVRIPLSWIANETADTANYRLVAETLEWGGRLYVGTHRAPLRSLAWSLARKPEADVNLATWLRPIQLQQSQAPRASHQIRLFG